MSGFKKMIVSINPEEVRNLIRIPSIKLKKNKATKDAGIHQSIEKQQAYEELQARQADFDDLLTSFSRDIQDIERSNQSAVLACQHSLEQHIQRTTGEMFAASQEMIIDQAGQLMNRFEEEKQYLQDQVAENRKNLAFLTENRERNSQGITQWLQAAGDLFYFIHDNYPLDPSTVDLMQRYENDLFLAAQNQADGMLEAALVSAQQVYGNLSVLRIQLEQIENERFIKKQQAFALADWLNQAAMEQRFCTAIDLQGNELDFTIDVDYWSKRKLSRLIEKTHRLMEYLVSIDHTIEMERLDQMLDDTLPAMKDELEQVLSQARVAAISSQLRLNIADVIVQALESQGFSLKSSSYSHEDMRKGYQARLQNIEGSAMEIQVLPLAGETVENDIQVKSFDTEMRTEHELMQRSQEIYRALGHYGLKVGAIQSQPDSTQRRAGALESGNALLLKKPLPVRCMG